MRATAKENTVTFDLISTSTDLGELAKLAVKLDYSVLIEPVETDGTYGVRMLRTRETSLENELVSLAVLHGFSEGISGSLLISRLQTRLEALHFPLDKPIQDVMDIGGGPDHEGHSHD